jgi:hypothetical protein
VSSIKNLKSCQGPTMGCTGITIIIIIIVIIIIIIITTTIIIIIIIIIIIRLSICRSVRRKAERT